MEIKEFINKKKQMEADIAIAVGALVEKFKVETGYCPDYISIDMVDITTTGQERKEYIVGNVTSDMELWRINYG